MRPKKKSNDAQKVERFLDDLRAGMEDYSPAVKTPPTLIDFLSSVVFLGAWALAGSIVAGLCLRVIRIVAGF